jgi:hypothetical protein
MKLGERTFRLCYAILALGAAQQDLCNSFAVC